MTTRAAEPGRQGFTALVLAGRRAGGDPVARAAGVDDKCLVPVAGVPMLERVLRALVASRSIARVLVVAENPAELERLPGLAALRQRRPIELVPAAGSPSASVLAALDHDAAAWPLLVTTADHALLEAGLVDRFCAAAGERAADVVAALTPAEVIRRSYPESVRTYLRFRDGSYSGANLFALLTPRSRRAVVFWRRAERERKRPWRLALAIGPGVLLAYLLGRLSLARALARISQASGARAAAVVLDVAEAAIDVDKPADLVLAERILAGRAHAGSGP